MKTNKKVTVGRRDFLRVLGTGAVGAGVASGGNTLPALADSETNDEKRKARYTESDDVKAFYRVNRYPQSR